VVGVDDGFGVMKGPIEHELADRDAHEPGRFDEEIVVSSSEAELSPAVLDGHLPCSVRQVYVQLYGPEAHTSIRRHGVHQRVGRRSIDELVSEQETRLVRRGAGSMAWNLTGSYVETCSCELMCPCNLSFDHGATYDFCRVTLVFNIREGQIDGTDIAGLKVAAIADTPKVMTEGNWRLGVFIDAQASDAQFDKLLQVFSGQLGGPMAALTPLVGEMLGAERASIEVVDDGLRHSVRIGDAVDFEIEDIVPFGVETGQPVRFDGMFHPVGSNLTMAEAKRSNINAFGIQYEGKTGLSTSEFSWAA
jgi:hypothetical protein